MLEKKGFFFDNIYSASFVSVGVRAGVVLGINISIWDIALLRLELLKKRWWYEWFSVRGRLGISDGSGQKVDYISTRKFFYSILSVVVLGFCFGEQK